MNRPLGRRPNVEEVKTAEKRRASFLASLSKDMLNAEDQLPAAISRLNASPRSKLNRIDLVADELSNARSPFVACAKGCSACCHMNVSVTRAEAERLGAAVGRRPVEIRETVLHASNEFSGKACPFLDAAGSCSIYADRPLACRKHASFFEDDLACQTGVMDEVEVPMVSFSGLDEALFTVSAKQGKVVLADIRDFFPPEHP